jgi:hypothetical protein
VLVRDWDKNDAKAWFPVSALLVAVIYTGSKSLVSAALHPPVLASRPLLGSTWNDICVSRDLTCLVFLAAPFLTFGL